MQNETAPDDGLLPCPFCGHEPYTTSDLETMKVAGKRTGHEFAVMCSWCEITAPGAARVDDAVTYWNRRAHTAQPAAGVLDPADQAMLAAVNDVDDAVAAYNAVGSGSTIHRLVVSVISHWPIIRPALTAALAAAPRAGVPEG